MDLLISSQSLGTISKCPQMSGSLRSGECEELIRIQPISQLGLGLFTSLWTPEDHHSFSALLQGLVCHIWEYFKVRTIFI